MKYIKVAIILLFIMLLLSFFACNRQNQVEENNPYHEENNDTEGIDPNETTSNQLEQEQGAKKIVLYFAEISANYELRAPWFSLNEERIGRLPIDFQNSPSVLLNDYLANPEIKALIIDYSYGMGSYPEWPQLLGAIREQYPNLLIIAIRPSEQAKGITDLVDLVIFDDYYAWGERIPEQAQKMKAEVLVYYYYPDMLERQYGELMIKNIDKKCMDIGLPYEKILLDVDSSTDITAAQEIVIANIHENVQKYGVNTLFSFFYYPKSRVYELASIYREIMQRKAMYVPGLPAYNSVEPYIMAFLNNEDLYRFSGSDYTGRFDYSWLNQRLKERMKELGSEGRFARDPVSHDVLPIEAAYQYAVAYANGNAVLKTADKEFFKKCLQESMAEFGCPEFEVYVNTYDDYAGNCFFFSTDLIVY